jgi:hypothetical protein
LVLERGWTIVLKNGFGHWSLFNEKVFLAIWNTNNLLLKTKPAATTYDFDQVLVIGHYSMKKSF